MPGEIQAPVGESAKPRDELGPISHNRVLIPGAGQGTGRAFAVALSRIGYDVALGTRSLAKFGFAREEIADLGGIEPRPFIADLTDPAQVLAAYESLGLTPGEPVDYAPFSAGGFDGPLRFTVGKHYLRLKKALEALRGQSISSDEERKRALALLNEITENIRGSVHQDRVVAPAMRINCDALVDFAELLKRNGHLNPQSTILLPSSTGSDQIDPQNPDNYPGPQLYFPIAYSKKMGVEKLRKIAERTGARFVDFVAPGIRDTEVGIFIESIAETLRIIYPDFTMLSVTRDQFTEAAVREFLRMGADVPQIRKAYLRTSGETVPNQPVEYREPILPFL